MLLVRRTRKTYVSEHTSPLIRMENWLQSPDEQHIRETGRKADPRNEVWQRLSGHARGIQWGHRHYFFILSRAWLEEFSTVMNDAPIRRNGNVNELTSQGRDQISRIPFLDGFPRGCSTPNDEGGVAGDKPHELEGTWFLV